MTPWKEQLAVRIKVAVARSGTIRDLVVGDNVLNRVSALLHRHFHDPSNVVLICDENTWAVAGRRVAADLAGAGTTVHECRFPASPRPQATMDNAESIANAVAEYGGVPLVVGSGVLNDLAKYAAARTRQPYFCVATAASMDGYASAGAPLIEGGFKHTVQCAAPRVMLADLDVVSAAPSVMAGWGYGDLAGKIPAGADWIVADALGIEPVDEVAWSLVHSDLRHWLGSPRGVAAGDHEAIAALFAGLVITGIAMEVHGSSRPASGADHQIAHLLEMEEATHDGELLSHGTCVALGTLAILALYEWLLGQDIAMIDPIALAANHASADRVDAAIRAQFGDNAVAERSVSEMRAKHVSRDQRIARLETIKQVWPMIRERLGEFLITHRDMSEKLHAAGVDIDPLDCGISHQHFRETVIRARYIRRRYTVLDLLADLNLLEPAVNTLFNETPKHAVAAASA